MHTYEQNLMWVYCRWMKFSHEEQDNSVSSFIKKSIVLQENILHNPYPNLERSYIQVYVTAFVIHIFGSATELVSDTSNHMERHAY